MRLRALSGFMARLFDPRRKARTVDAATGLSGDASSVPLGGTRAQTTQRLQVGIAGLAGTLLGRLFFHNQTTRPWSSSTVIQFSRWLITEVST